MFRCTRGFMVQAVGGRAEGRKSHGSRARTFSKRTIASITGQGSVREQNKRGMYVCILAQNPRIVTLPQPINNILSIRQHCPRVPTSRPTSKAFDLHKLQSDSMLSTSLCFLFSHQLYFSVIDVAGNPPKSFSTGKFRTGLSSPSLKRPVPPKAPVSAEYGTMTLALHFRRSGPRLAPFVVARRNSADEWSTGQGRNSATKTDKKEPHLPRLTSRHVPIVIEVIDTVDAADTLAEQPPCRSYALSRENVTPAQLRLGASRRAPPVSMGAPSNLQHRLCTCTPPAPAPSGRRRGSRPGSASR